MTSPIKMYFDTVKLYTNKYGPKTCVLIEVGSFYEMYGIDKSDIIFEVASILHIIVTKKNKNIQKISMGNPYMSGFTSGALSKYCSILLANGYTVVQIIQEQKKPNQKTMLKRHVERIYSPSTTLDLSEDALPYYDKTSAISNVKNEQANLVVIYIESNLNIKSKQKEYNIGVSSIDLTLGVSKLKEMTISKLSDLYDIVKPYNPLEIIIIPNSLESNDSNDLLKITQLISDAKQIKLNKSMMKIDYQEALLKKVYNLSQLGLSTIELLNLEMYNYSRLSFCYGLEYAYEHDKRIIYKIQKPEILDNNNKLYLNVSAFDQLQIFPTNKTSNKSVSSLFCIFNKTKTILGKRLLRERLQNPITDISLLKQRYKSINDMKNIDVKIENYLTQIKDIERLHRKLQINILRPYELMILHQSYQNILKVFDIIRSKNNLKKRLTNLIEHYSKIINVDHLLESNSIIINNGISLELDEINLNKNNLWDEMNKIVKKLESSIPQKNIAFRLEYNEKIGHFIKTTTNRAKLVEKNWKESDKLIKLSGSTVKLMTSKMKELSLQYMENEIKYDEITNDIYKQELDKLSNLDSKLFLDLSQYIANIDLSYTLAILSSKYRYTEPKIKSDDASFVKGKAIRHAIAEQIHKDTVFVPNDINLIKHGQVITGMNGAGKSVYIKSVALCIFMAQCGLFVPAESFEYNPYHFLLTRIGNGDNIFKGHSTFVCEMLELKEILEKASENTFVIADELCAGSETVSAKAILASCIISLSKKETSFMITTHIHGLEKLDEVNKIKNKITFGHIAVETIKDGDIRYLRKFKEGVSGTLYGLEVCRHLIDDNIFIEQATKIRKQIIGHNPDKIIQSHRSKYNSKVLIDNCQICGVQAHHEGDLDVHHIKFQSTADKCGYIDHIHKNLKGNLVVLCKKHHRMVHNKEIIINGWEVSIRDGLVLDYVENKIH